MSTKDKVIKYIAIGLAAFIIINIVSGVLYLMSWITPQNDNKTIVKHFEESYQNINEIEIETITADVLIVDGYELKVEANNLKNKLVSKNNNGELKIEELKTNVLFDSDNRGLITITIPKNLLLNELSIDSGAGEININNININNFSLDLGAGSIKIINSKFNNTDIEGGAGKIEIKESTLKNLEFDAGVGKTSIEAYIPGNSEIDCGIGQVDIVILDKEDDFTFSVEKGIGTIKINGIEYGNTTKVNGSNKFNIEGGVCSCNINFK